MNSLLNIPLGPLSIAISLLIGLLAIAITFYFGVRKPIRESFDELSKELKKNRIDEKIGELNGYVYKIPTWSEREYKLESVSARIMKDLESVGRLSDSLSMNQKQELRNTIDQITDEIRDEYDDSEEYIDRIYNTLEIVLQ